MNEGRGDGLLLVGVPSVLSGQAAGRRLARRSVPVGPDGLAA